MEGFGGGGGARVFGPVFRFDEGGGGGACFGFGDELSERSENEEVLVGG